MVANVPALTTTADRRGGASPLATLRRNDRRRRPRPRAARRAAPASADLLGHPAVGDRPPRQRPGRDPQLRDAPVRVRGDLLHRRLPRADQHPRRGRDAPADARDGGEPARARPRPGAVHAVRPEPSPGAHRAHVAAGHGHAGELARADADLQGEEGQPARRHQPRAAHLPGPAGGRHRHLQGVAGAGGQGPGRAPRAVTRDRPGVQQPLRRDVPGAARRCSPRRPSCWARTA